jgi:hypothetical protein
VVVTIRVKRPDGSWDEIPTGRIDFHDRGGVLNVKTDDEPVVYEPEDWESFEVVGEADPVLITGETEERVFPEGFV